MRCSHPQALTICSGDLPLARSKDPRKTFPSMAIGEKLDETLERDQRLAVIMNIASPARGGVDWLRRRH